MWYLICILAIILAMYWYKKTYYLAYSDIRESSQISKFVWSSRTFIQNTDGSISRVFGYASEDNDVRFFIYLDANDSRVKEFEKKDELFAHVDFQYIEDYFNSSKEENPFTMLGRTPFAAVSNISCIGYDGLDIYEHSNFYGIGSYTRLPFSKERATSTLNSRIGISVDASKLLYNH